MARDAVRKAAEEAKPEEAKPYYNDLRMLLNSIQMPSGAKVSAEQVEGCVTAMHNAWLDLDTLKTSFNDKQGRGVQHVIEHLIDAGVEPPELVIELANAIAESCQDK